MTHLDDASAILILKNIVRSHFADNECEIQDTPELREALAAAFGGPSPPAASEGDLARAALELLADDPRFAESIELAILDPDAVVSSSPERYVDGSTITLAAAALLVLSTRIKFKIDSSRKWSFEIEKKSAGDGIVRLLVERLLSVLRG
jgi:hypothetical protein